MKVNKFWFAFKHLHFTSFFTSIALVSVVPVIYLLFYQETINLITESIKNREILPVTKVLHYLSYLFGTLLASQTCHYLSSIFFAKSASYFRNSLKSYLFKNLMTIRMRYIQTHDTAFLERQISEYPESFIHFLQVIIQNFIPFLISGIIIVRNGFDSSIYIGTLYITWALVVFGGIFASISYINNCQTEFTVSSGVQSDFVTENIRNFVVNKVFPHGFTMNKIQFMNYQKSSNDAFELFFTRVGLYRLIFGMISGTFFCLVVFMVITNSQSSSLLSIGLMAQATKFTSSIWDMITSSLPIVQYFGKINTYGSIIDIFNKDHRVSKIDNIDEIVISNLNFEYPAKKIFTNFSCQINKGDRIWLKAPSGTGKSTFINIILGLLHVPRGSVFINGQDIEDINNEFIMKNATLVTQNDFLFHDSIIANVKRSNHILTDEMVEELSSKFYLDRIGLPLEHECGYKGSKVSSGQAKVICLTRAFGKFYKNNTTFPLIILDEPFVGCDRKIIEAIIKTFQELQNVTLIVCDHNEHAAQITNKVIELG